MNPFQVPPSFLPEDSHLNFPSDIVTADINIARQKLNFWKYVLADRAVTLAEALNRRTQNPSLVVTTQQGKKSISEICSLRAPGVLEARSYVEVLEKIVAGEISLASLWNDDAVASASAVPFDTKESPDQESASEPAAV